MSRRSQVRALAVAVIALLFGGGVVVARHAGDPGAYSGTGTALPGGLVVVEGSELIGPAFPVPSRQRAQRIAVLRVLGDPVEVLRRYIDQIVALPQPEPRARVNVRCDVFRNVPNGDDDVTAEPLAAATHDEADGIVCSAVQQPTARSPGYDLTLVRATHPTRAAAVSGITLRVDAPADVRASTGPSPEPLPVGRVRVDVDLPPLARVGEVFGDYPSSGLDRGLRVEPGSALRGPVASNGCTTGGFAAVLEISGDPDEVVARYGAQFAARGFPVAEDLRTEVDGRPVRKVVGHTAGGGTLEALHLVDGSRDWLLITRCND